MISWSGGVDTDFQLLIFVFLLQYSIVYEYHKDLWTKCGLNRSSKAIISCDQVNDTEAGVTIFFFCALYSYLFDVSSCNGSSIFLTSLFL